MAGSLNKVILIGNLGADPEIKEMPDGTKMAKFSIILLKNILTSLEKKLPIQIANIVLGEELLKLLKSI